jgi:hypothetical protein
VELEGDEIMSNARNEGRKDLAPTPDLTMEQVSSQKTRQSLFRRRQRELLAKVQWQLAAEASQPSEKELFVRCPKCGEAVSRIAR